MQLTNITLQAGVSRKVGTLSVHPTVEVIGSLSYGSYGGYVSIHTNGEIYCQSGASGDFSGQVVILK